MLLRYPKYLFRIQMKGNDFKDIHGVSMTYHHDLRIHQGDHHQKQIIL